ncbi:hypothetical protein FOXB_12350, partial [Fusarium oxysporum f. sp. conglutinans Fo5176]
PPRRLSAYTAGPAYFPGYIFHLTCPLVSTPKKNSKFVQVTSFMRGGIWNYLQSQPGGLNS